MLPGVAVARTTALETTIELSNGLRDAFICVLYAYVRLIYPLKYARKLHISLGRRWEFAFDFLFIFFGNFEISLIIRGVVFLYLSLFFGILYWQYPG